MTLSITIDDRTEKDLRRLSASEGVDVADIASRLLARAVRAARPKPTFDVDALRVRYAEFAEEDAALAESGAEERAELLENEDRG